MDSNDVVLQTRSFVKNKLLFEGSGHDWWHVDRVERLAVDLAHKEAANRVIVSLAALLHDIADWKFHGGDKEIGPLLAGEHLRKLGVCADWVGHICGIIRDLSFIGGAVEAIPMKTIEGMVVQDADRLDAIGAVGIARVFAYGGHKGTEIFNPSKSPTIHKTADEYMNNRSPAINHFYEKLLLLKDRMNTLSARSIAEKRHAFMELYLKTFFDEAGRFYEDQQGRSATSPPL